MSFPLKFDFTNKSSQDIPPLENAADEAVMKEICQDLMDPVVALLKVRSSPAIVKRGDPLTWLDRPKRKSYIKTNRPPEKKPMLSGLRSVPSFARLCYLPLQKSLGLWVPASPNWSLTN